MDPVIDNAGGTGSAEMLPPSLLARIENAAVTFSAAAVLLLCVLVTLAVIGRISLWFKIPDHIIFSGELMVTLVALPWALVARQHGHVAVEVFTKRAGPPFRLVLAVLAAAVGVAMILPLGFAAYESFVRVVEKGSYFDGDLFWPEWPGRLMFAIGFALLAVRLLVSLVRAVRRLLQGNLSEITPESGYF